MSVPLSQIMKVFHDERLELLISYSTNRSVILLACHLDFNRNIKQERTFFFLMSCTRYDY